jgi:hypothetical protein
MAAVPQHVPVRLTQAQRKAVADELLEWVGGKFDPERFDPAKATKAMKKGLPDWRRDEWF